VIANLTRLTLPLEGVIERRLLITYRLDPTVARTLLTRGLRPQLDDARERQVRASFAEAT
jgi:hypothetical protein